MSFTSNCPKCQQPITIPDSVGPAALVRCPLCDEQYPLGEALALAPPALIVVAGGEEAPLAASAAELPPVTLSDEAAPTPSAMFEEAVQSAAEHEAPAALFDEPVAFAERAEDAEGQPAAEGDADHWTAGWATPPGEASAQAAEADVEAEDEVDLAEEENDAAVFGAITGKLPRAPAGAEGAQPPASAGVAVGGPAAGGVVLPPLPKKRRRRRETSPLGRGIGMVLSGLLAVVLFYYGVNFFGGKRFDMFEIYLPGVPHTYEHWRWYTPWKGEQAKNGKAVKKNGAAKTHAAKSPFADALAVPIPMPVPQQNPANQQPAPSRNRNQLRKRKRTRNRRRVRQRSRRRSPPSSRQPSRERRNGGKTRRTNPIPRPSPTPWRSRTSLPVLRRRRRPRPNRRRLAQNLWERRRRSRR